ncbi:MAG: DUF5054 domain-containing protein [Clostridia bacterium]|nr:DUF5054 domain-containing protein [Clostridia bacterium]
MIKDVLIIFKTHLDIGFCDMADNVVKRYLNEFIPNAIKRGYELKDTDTPYIWTVGSWLINEALKNDHDGAVAQAIRDGIIVWHALPFTFFTEVMSKELLDYALSISTELDLRFGKKTIAAKMSDVPGHTKAMIPFLAKHGVEFLHLGVNPAYPLPSIPPLCRWKYLDDEIIMMYQSDYGNTMEFDDFVITFGFTHDNTGPQSVEEIQKIYRELHEKYPHASIRAATLDDAAIMLRKVKDSLPIVTEEIGDLWIQNAGTDPKKLSLYRELLRYIEKNGIIADLSDNLLLVPEHTWGGYEFMFDNFSDYLLEDFSKVSHEEKARYEQSWQEQRDYIDKAQQVLGTDFTYQVDEPDISNMVEIPLPTLDFEISWQLFDNDDYKRFVKKCIKEEMQTVEWIWMDNTKYKLPDYKGGIYTASADRAYSDGKKTVIQLSFAEKIAQKQGLPRLYAILENNMIEIRFFSMAANRLPQAYWFKYRNSDESGWQIRKLGEWIDAEDVIYSPLLAATDYGVRNQTTEIEAIDSPLVAPYGRRLLDAKSPSDPQDMYFNLYNNIWGCNHPMWYDDDSRFRFVIHKKKS